ncbi:light-harvesting protein [Nannochloropsis gaditana]|uniref:Light-harvesting protein n=1 Tax=Nannochloropsis gaditana TaxID=72520 RepID=W7UAI7_9STRA|nr:light-harvesting protein [Nannochloropsis gaditana]
MRSVAFIVATTAAMSTAFVLPSAPKAPQTQLAAKSKAVPFLEAPKALDGSLPADVGFDPLNLSDIDFDFTYLMVPTKWDESRTGLSALKWFREAEIKHGRFAMLAVLGWVAVDMGLRLPVAKYAGYNAVQAHDVFVKSGDMTVGLLAIGFLEVVMGAGIYEMSKGSDRAAGDFSFDPLGLGKDPAKYARYQVSEIKNGRLAMLAFGGIATQAVLTNGGFPYYQ